MVKQKYISPFDYNKETSTILKGVAILMMVFLHLFNRDSQIELYSSVCLINGHPLAQCFAKACNPVGLYLFLSGYGLFSSFKLKNYIGGGKKRILSLYLGLWATYIVFVPICAWLVNDDRYPGSFMDAISNIFAYTCSWNHTTWFILPFAIIMMTCAAWFRMMKTTKQVWAVFASSFVLYYIVAVIYGRYWTQVYEMRFILVLCRYFEQLCPFLFGAVICYFSEIKIPCRISSEKTQISILLLILLCFSYSTAKGIPYYPIYCGVLMLLFANLKYSKRIAQVLTLLGRHSMTIWLIHTYFCDELLRSFIYGFRYPLLIFVIEVLISTLAAIIIDKLFQPIKARMLNLICK